MTPCGRKTEDRSRGVDLFVETRCAAGHTSTARLIGHTDELAGIVVSVIATSMRCACGARLWHQVSPRELLEDDRRSRVTLPAPPPLPVNDDDEETDEDLRQRCRAKLQTLVAFGRVSEAGERPPSAIPIGADGGPVGGSDHD